MKRAFMGRTPFIGQKLIYWGGLHERNKTLDMAK